MPVTFLLASGAVVGVQHLKVSRAWSPSFDVGKNSFWDHMFHWGYNPSLFVLPDFSLRLDLHPASDVRGWDHSPSDRTGPFPLALSLVLNYGILGLADTYIFNILRVLALAFSSPTRLVAVFFLCLGTLGSKTHVVVIIFELFSLGLGP